MVVEWKELIAYNFMIIALLLEVLRLIGLVQSAGGALVADAVLRRVLDDVDPELLSEINGLVDVLGAAGFAS